MKTHACFLTVRAFIVTALVLTVLVFWPGSSQALFVQTDGNTATGIDDLECGQDVFIDVRFVFDVGTAVYGPHPGEFPYEGLNGATREEGTFALGVCIQNALNDWTTAITRVGPEDKSYFLIAGEDDLAEPEAPWIYAAFESRYYDTIPEPAEGENTIRRPAETWVPADNFLLQINLFPEDPEFNPVDLDYEGLPFGAVLVPETEAYSWAVITTATGSPLPPDVNIGGSVTGLLGSGLVLQNNNADDESITDDGAFTFNSTVPAGSEYYVTVSMQPISPEQKCTVARGADIADSGDVNDVLVTCTDPPAMPSEVATLITPNGGEAFVAGSQQLIEWTSAVGATTYDVRLSYDGGGTWFNIATGVAGTNYLWTVPDNNVSTALVRVVAYNGGTWLGSDDSDAPFTITKTGSLINPSGGELINGGSIYNIQWVANPSATSYVIRLSYDNGVSFWNIASGVVGTNFDWTVPNNNVAGTAVVKVVSYNGGTWIGASDSNGFTIVKQ
jgi:hypothetical protein